MKAVNQTYATLINGNKQFVIPVFQRDYSWTPEQCAQLWHDVWRSGERDPATPHFMGSVVYVGAGQTSATFSSWLVIDGQQRLTTLALLLTALRNHINKTDWKGGENSPTAEKIDAYFLQNVLETGDKRYKLALRRHDDMTLRALVDGEAHDESNSSQSILDAYEWFADTLAKTANPDRVYRGICKLEIVEVTLDQNDRPQLVFESLNSTGVDLTQSDLIRNYILMGLDEPEQTRLYDQYWSKIENLFRSANFRRTNKTFDYFLRDYITLKIVPPKSAEVSQLRTDRIRADRIYDEFKEFRHDDQQDLEALLQEMMRFAGYYLDLLGQRSELGMLSEAMRHVCSLGTTHAVLGMKLYACHKRPQSTLSENQFSDALRLIESYIVRRGVLGLENRSYGDVFAELARSIDESNPLESMKVAFAIRRHYHFPEDAEFKREIQECNLYEKKELCRHVLARMENDRQKEPSPIGGLSIEHIMPQGTPNAPDWQKMLGDDWETVYETWLHRLGNLTLTAYNSELSTRTFAMKKKIKGGFKKSAVRLNSYVKKQDVWTKKEMRKRGKNLANCALEIWPHHRASVELVQAREIEFLRDRSKLKDSSSLKMSNSVRKLLDNAEASIAKFGDIIRIVERKSVCCYMPEFFVEVMPMRNSLRFILPLNFEEVEVPSGLYADDTTTWKFVPNRMHTECNMLVEVYDEKELNVAMPIVRQAYNQVNEQA